MKIRNRLTILNATSAFATMVLGGVFIYWFSARFHHREFFHRLEERVDITEQIFLEKDGYVTQTVREKFLHSLDDEKEFAFTMNPSGLDSLDRFVQAGLSTKIAEQKTFFFWQNGRQGVCKRYQLHGGEYAVVVTAVDIFGRSKLDYLIKILFSGALLGGAVLVVVGYWSTGRALRPLHDKIRRASHISAEQLDLRLEVINPNDELGELGVAFNSMLDRLQASFEAQRRFVSNASHELRNPMTAIIGQAEVLLAKERSPEEYRAALQVIQGEAEWLEQLTSDLLSLANSDSLTKLPSPQPIAFDSFLLEVLEKFPAERLLLHLPEMDSSPVVLASAPLLNAALSNILENAFKYSETRPVQIYLMIGPMSCLLKVVDEGVGIPADDMGKIYQPFFRAQNVRHFRGTGVGLPLAKKVIELHDGQLEVLSKEGKGTTVTVFLQLYSK